VLPARFFLSNNFLTDPTFAKVYMEYQSILGPIWDHHKDLVGLLYSLIGFFITLGLEHFLKADRVFMACLGVSFAAMGFGITIFVEDDGDLYWNLSWLEEALTAGILGIALVQFGIVISEG